jgi:hypothetical protein
VVTLTNVGTSYDTIGAANGLGFSEIDFRGATQVTFRVRHQKVGTGTITYQLWAFDINASGAEINGQSVAEVSDATAAGVAKYLTVTAAVDINAVKLCRVRAKSTVSADDPLFHGSSILLNN